MFEHTLNHSTSSSARLSRRVAAMGLVALAASLAACGSGSDNTNAGATATRAVL